jgi:hypothetical protein
MMSKMKYRRKEQKGKFNTTKSQVAVMLSATKKVDLKVGWILTIEILQGPNVRKYLKYC